MTLLFLGSIEADRPDVNHNADSAATVIMLIRRSVTSTAVIALDQCEKELLW